MQIMTEARTMLGDAVYTICGSFRRGAPNMHDVDIVMTGTTQAPPTDVLQQLAQRLRRRGCLTHLVSMPRSSNARVDVVQMVYRATPTALHRRVDVVFAQRAQYGAAVLGWTGSVVYERDLRRWARSKGYSVRICI